jgi:hypothetical protein
MENKKRLVIGIPTNGTLHWMFARDLMTLSVPDKTGVVWVVRSMIDTARNNLVNAVIDNPEITHLLMIDDDMTFEPDFAVRLLQHDVDIVGGLAFKRREDYQPCVYRKNEKGQYIPILPEIFQEVDIVGTGGIMIKVEALRKMKFPWFETVYDEKGTYWSVDFQFCKKAKEAGCRIFVDPEAEMGHIGDAPVIKKETFLTYVEEMNKKNKINEK